MDGPYLEKGYFSLDIEDCPFWVNQGPANTFIKKENFCYFTIFLLLLKLNSCESLP